MITGNVIHRVFRIAVDQTAGTAFTIDVSNRQYLVTARHVASAIAGQSEIKIFADRTWVPLAVQLVGHAQGDIDVSVLTPERRLTLAPLPLKATEDGLTYGQEAFFLGFPYDILSKFIFGEGGYPLPLVKRATVSCFDVGLILLDGHNNPGFSGGPVVFIPPGERAFQVAGVISGFRVENEPILAGGQATPLVYRDNTGIILAYSINHALTLIGANPIGFPL